MQYARCVAGVLASMLAAANVVAQDYPSRPIRITVPYAAGGVTDIVTRLVTPKMSEVLGQPIVVENVPSAGGVPGTNTVARAAPDGYHLIAAFDSFATNPFLYQGVQHDPIKDFAPISLMVRSPQLLVVHASVGAQTLADLVRIAKEKGDRIAFATAGAGTSSRLSTELFKEMAGLDLTLVQYRGGAPALNDVIGGQVAGMIASISLVFPHVQRGRLVALGVSSAKRSPQAPNVPTIGETYPGFEAQSWTGMLAPAGTPRPVLDRLHDAVTKALAIPEVREKLASQGVEIVASSPEVFRDWIRAESQKWGRVIRERKITLE